MSQRLWGSRCFLSPVSPRGWARGVHLGLHHWPTNSAHPLRQIRPAGGPLHRGPHSNSKSGRPMRRTPYTTRRGLCHLHGPAHDSDRSPCQPRPRSSTAKIQRHLDIAGTDVASGPPSSGLPATMPGRLRVTFHPKSNWVCLQRRRFLVSQSSVARRPA